ncbi:universal stress protein, partial [Rhizobiaceae sp. 2RAB30]
MPGQDVASEIVRYATTHNFSHIVVGKPAKPRWREFFGGSVTHDLIRQAGNLSIHVASGSEQEVGAPRDVKAAAPSRRLELWP